MKESLARALSGPISLMEDEWRERPVDRLHALASAQSVINTDNFKRTAREAHLSSLGVSLIALKAANRADEYARAVDKLSRALETMKPGASLTWRIKLARQAIQENVIDFCPRCRGAKEIPADADVEGAQRMIPCPSPDEKSGPGCGGTGRRRYTDKERLEALEADPIDSGRIEAQMAAAMALIALAESEAIRSAKRLLERW